MNTPSNGRPLTVALLGNPNTGKSTLFSCLVGVRQRTGNYPGVTVEKKVGQTQIGDHPVTVIDLPGTYSLAPHSPDEMVAVDVLLGRQADVAKPDVVLCIVDASNLARNLYLVSQILELGLPTVICLNMIDVAQRKGIQFDVEQLSQRLDVPLIPVQANRQVGIDQVRRAIVDVAESPQPSRTSPLPAELQSEVDRLYQFAAKRPDQPALPRYLIERLLLDTGYLDSASLPGVDQSLRAAVAESRNRLTTNGTSLVAAEAIARYDWVGKTLDGIVQHQPVPKGWSDRLDEVLTHRLWGTLIFVSLMVLIFQSVFSWSGWFMDTIESAVEAVGLAIGSTVPEGPLQSLLVDGVVAGVGGVLVFLPQIFFLFFFIAVLEDCGYMARAAYLMDKLMSRIGLSGKSFIPLLSSFACAIPGIMATRVIENRRDRLVTILIAPLMSCSARLPVYTLLIAAFIPKRPFLGGLMGLQGLVLFAMYSLGMLVAVIVALVLKRTLLPGDVPPFVMELPSYKFPDPRMVLYRMTERGWAFVRRAGTLIFAVTIVVWAAGYFPRNQAEIEAPFAVRRAELAQLIAGVEATPENEETLAGYAAELQAIDNQIAGQSMRQSYLGRLGRWVEPLVKPLGWDWRIGCAAIASFPAREVVVGSLGVIYNLGDDEDTTSLADALHKATWEDTDRPVFNIPVALSIMVFFALCAQCVSTLAIMRRETNSWRWPVFSFAYMTVLAYLGACITYQIGIRIGG